MFAVYCQNHRARVLLWEDCITAVVNVPGSRVVVRWRCPCGQEGEWWPAEPRLPLERRSA